MRRIVLTAMLVLFGSIVISVSQAAAAEIEGVVLSAKGPAGDGSVLAFARLADIPDGEPLARSVAGSRPGHFRLTLQPGRYFLVAHGTMDGAPQSAFHGANPITVQVEDRLWLPFTVVPDTVPIRRPEKSSVISGVVTYRGEPVTGSQVSLYATADEQVKGMGLLTSTSGNDGSFRLPVAAGSYRLVARRRSAQDGAMPLRKGDLFCYPSANPIQVSDKEEVSVNLPCYPRDDVEGFLANAATVKRNREGLSRFRDKPTGQEQAETVSGRVTDLSGKPVAGVVVQAYRALLPGPFQMHSLRLMPDQQVAVNQDGRYRMTLPGDGRFHLVAREQSGKAPFKGEWYGLYEGDRDHAVTAGVVPASADIVVSRLMTEEPISKHPRMDRRVTQTTGVLRVANLTIDRDTVWQGDVEITGTVLVRRGATLSVQPGTTVRFVRTDSNGDGIGDGEIRVLGRLVAQGTKGKPVRFRSASKRPRPGDWSFLLVYASAGETSLRHAIVEDAFSGLQVHFSRARVTDSIFRNNREGIRFGRAELVIENNEITKNRYGIRHTRLEGSILIRYNAIHGNHVGIFLVPSNQNIIDFSDTYTIRDRPARDQPIVCYNNLAGNRLYAYQFGERQGYDVDLAGNWWGSTDMRVIRKKIYDRDVDPTLGSARIFPVLRAPARGAGVGKGGA